MPLLTYNWGLVTNIALVIPNGKLLGKVHAKVQINGISSFNAKAEDWSKANDEWLVLFTKEY